MNHPWKTTHPVEQSLKDVYPEFFIVIHDGANYMTGGKYHIAATHKRTYEDVYADGAETIDEAHEKLRHALSLVTGRQTLGDTLSDIFKGKL